ncbi:MAG: hypothetical protein KGQ66_16825 [Acidobacteriota bacterium]|nr:hypothetical protein [Acidobacteriota bacterium]
MLTTHPTRRTGLGRGLAEIAATAGQPRQPAAAGPLVAGPALIPLDVVPFAMLLADRLGHVRATNHLWERASGLGPEPSRGTGWLAALAGSARHDLTAGVAAARPGGPVQQGALVWAGGRRRSTWLMVAHEQAGEVVVGIAIGQPEPLAAADPLLYELRGLLDSAEEMALSLDRLIGRLTGSDRAAGSSGASSRPARRTSSAETSGR